MDTTLKRPIVKLKSGKIVRVIAPPKNVDVKKIKKIHTSEVIVGTISSNSVVVPTTIGNQKTVNNIKIVEPSSEAHSGTKCSIDGCHNYIQQTDKKTFLRFPQDYVLSRKWVEAVNCKAIDDMYMNKGVDYLYKNARVCSDHFQEKDFRNKNLYSEGIYDGVIPSKNLVPRTEPLRILTSKRFRPSESNNNKNTSKTQQSPLIKSLKNSTPLNKNQKDGVEFKVNNCTKVLTPITPPKNLNRKEVILLPKCTNTVKILQKQPSNNNWNAYRLPDIKQESGNNGKSLQARPSINRSSNLLSNVKRDTRTVVSVQTFNSAKINQLQTRLQETQRKLRTASSLLSKYRARNERNKTLISKLRKEVTGKNPFEIATIYPLDSLPERYAKCHRFSKNIRRFIVDLYYSSPLSYKVLGKEYCFPNRTTLKHWLKDSKKDNIVANDSTNDDNPPAAVVSDSDALNSESPNEVQFSIEIIDENKLQYVHEELVGESVETSILNDDFSGNYTIS